MTKILVLTLILTVLPCTVHALDVRQIKERKHDFLTLMKELTISDGDAARLSSNIHNPFPLYYYNTLEGSALMEVFEAVNKRPIVPIYIDGFYDSAHEYYKEETAKLDANEIVLLYWDLWSIKHEKRFFGFAVDRNINFRRSIASRLKLLPMYMNGPALLVAFREDINKHTIAFDQVSIGKQEQFERLLSKPRLQGRGLMREVFWRLEFFLKNTYYGWTLYMDPVHRTTKEFANKFDPLNEKNRFYINGSRLSYVIKMRLRFVKDVLTSN